MQKKTTRSILILIISLMMAIFSLAFIDPATTQPSTFSNYTGAALTYQTTSTPETTGDRSEIGSTDGITIASFIIVAIIIIPLVIKRRSWTQEA